MEKPEADLMKLQNEWVNGLAQAATAEYVLRVSPFAWFEKED